MGLKHRLSTLKRKVLHKWQKPNGILKKEEVDFNIVEIDHLSYHVANITDGQIFTNRISNISVIQDKKIVPIVSWQYSEGKVLPDNQNYLFENKVLLSQLPLKVKGKLISLLSGGGANYNYYHWLYDALPRLFLSKSLNTEDTMYFIPEYTHNFQKETLKILDIPKNRCISSKEHQHVKSEKLVITAHPNPNASIIPKWIFQFLRDSFLNNASETTTDYVYISRGDSVNARVLINEKELIKVLKPIGFKIYQLSELSFTEQVSLFANAKIIVGVHGAGFANLTFASNSAVVYELFSTNYQPVMYESISTLGALSYNRIVCETIENDKGAQGYDLKISQEQIQKIVEHAQNL